MAKIILTGASGFIGRHVLGGLIEDGHTILAPSRCIDKLSEEFDSSPRVTLLNGRFDAPEILQEYHNFAPDMILHFAAIRGDGNGRWKDYYDVNVRGTHKLVEFSLHHNITRFVYCSTVGVYGTIPCRLPADPWTYADPEGNYHISKYKAEKLIVHRLKGKIPFVIFRPTITYGMGDNGFLPKLISMVRKHYFPLINQDILIHLLNVNILREFIQKVVKHEELPQDFILNLADKTPVPLTDLVDLIHQYFYGSPYPRKFLSPPFLFRVAEGLTNVVNIKGIHISLKLISRSWYYDTSYIEKLCSCPLADTLESVAQYLKEAYPKHESAPVNQSVSTGS